MSKTEKNPESIGTRLKTAEEATRAVEELLRQGVPRDCIEVQSSEPIHFSGAAAASHKKSWIWLFGIAGGIVGALAAVLLTVWTSRRVNLVTGGMPIASPWPLGVIVFEMTALGAILFSVVRMIFEARLGRRRSDDDEAALAEGDIV